MIIDGTYKTQDLSVIILMVLERVVSLIAEQSGNSFEGAYKEFLHSDTHRRLADPKTLMWAESAEFILDDYYDDKGLGHSWQYNRRA
jgi:hypothetical protein